MLRAQTIDVLLCVLGVLCGFLDRRWGINRRGRRGHGGLRYARNTLVRHYQKNRAVAQIG